MLLEAKLLDSPSGARRPLYVPPLHSVPAPSLPPLLPAPPPRPPPAPNQRGPLPIRRLSSVEMQARRAKGLCFNCDDPFTPGYRCRPKFLLLLSEDESLIVEPPAVIPDKHSASELVPPPPLPTVILSADSVSPSELFQLSLDALSGSPSPRTLRLRGSVCGFPVTILVDSGSSHNIIQPLIAHHLRLAVQPLAPFEVMVGNGDALCCSGFCPSVSLVLQGHSFTVPSIFCRFMGLTLSLAYNGCRPWVLSFRIFRCPLCISITRTPSLHLLVLLRFRLSPRPFTSLPYGCY
ncbi:UNVERIFIED_CONTAM: hypothetical protein Sangu_1177500 [Sesamum angustifolium]|uniref:Uncharacterized protein n=1 Tax=Sesamum angustifolium TaxID=2727405 RepID=A0AAW2NHX8_9LAMI